MENRPQGIHVLSLFDGMSCGQIALERAGVNVKKYYASEIDKHAISVTQYNYPNTKQLGPVEGVLSVNPCDLVIGGSPCQGFSYAGGMLNFNDPRSRLFFEYIRILKNNAPKYFLYENVIVRPEIRDIISEQLGVEPVKIDSRLLSAQRRRRYYWTNIPFDQIKDKGIIFKDILDLESDRAELYLSDKEIQFGIDKHRGKVWKSGNRMGNMKFPNTTDKKSQCLTTVGIRGARETNHVEDIHGIRVLTRNEYERLQTIPVGYTDCIREDRAKKMIGNGWTVDVIAHILRGMK